MDIENILVEDELMQIAQTQLTDLDRLKELKVASRRHAVREAGGLLFAMSIADFREGTIEEIGATMTEFIDGPDMAYEFPPDYWRSLKNEFRTFLCTEDKEYADLRRKLETVGTKSQTTIVGMIAAAIAVHVGIAAGALVPFCALGLVAVVRLGKNAFCKMHALDIEISKKEIRKNAKRKKTASPPPKSSP
jgi:hypothetical protein